MAFFCCSATFSGTIMRHCMVSLTAVLKVLSLNRCLKAGLKHGMDQRPSLNRCHSLTWDVRASEFILLVYLLSPAVCTCATHKGYKETKTKQTRRQCCIARPPTLTPPLARHPNSFNYIFSRVVRLSNQGADIDACADKSTNTGNEISKDFEERVTANFAQWSMSHSGVMFW